MFFIDPILNTLSMRAVYHCLVFLIFMTLIGGCSQELSTSSDTPYRFGGIFQLTGPQSFYGNLAKYGMELAIEDLNNAGGINGRKIIGVYEDSAGDRVRATTAAQKLIQVDNVDALFTITPGMAGAVAPIAEENKVPYIYIGSVNTFTINKTYVFKDYPSPQDLCQVLMKKAIDLGHKRVALFGPNDEVTHLCREGAERVAPLLIVETFNPGDTDVRTQFTKIQQVQPSALLLYSLSGDCPNAFKQLGELGLKIQLFLPVQSFACGNTENTRTYGPFLSNALGSDIALDEASTDPRFLSFKERLVGRNWLINIRGTALEYDIIHEMARAYTGCDNRVCVADNLRALQMEGLTGKLHYDGGQIVTRDVMLTRLSDKGWVNVE